MALYCFKDDPSYEVEAFQLPALLDFDTEPFTKWAEQVELEYFSDYDGGIAIAASNWEPHFRVSPGEWIIKHGPMDFAAATDSLFKNIYEAVK